MDLTAQNLTAQRRVVFDTTACIYYLERPAVDPRCAVLLPVVAAAQAGTVDLMISTVTVTELLTAPLRDGNREAEAAVRLFMSLLCTVVPCGGLGGPRVADSGWVGEVACGAAHLGEQPGELGGLHLV